MASDDPFTKADPLYTITGLTDPEMVQLHVASVVTQLHDARTKLLGTFPLLGGYELPVVDMSNAIGDIVIETSAQGSSILELHIIDPYWQLMESRFIDTYDDGWLIPLDLTFPKGTSQRWRLCACNPSTDMAGPNLVLTFEDLVVSEMREHRGPVQSTATELLHVFIANLVKAAPDATFFSELENEAKDIAQVQKLITPPQPTNRHSSSPSPTTHTAAWNAAYHKGFQGGYDDGLKGKPNRYKSFGVITPPLSGSSDSTYIGYLAGYGAGVAAHDAAQTINLVSGFGAGIFGIPNPDAPATPPGPGR